jgi:hypothetical protein
MTENDLATILLANMRSREVGVELGYITCPPAWEMAENDLANMRSREVWGWS